MCHAIYRMQLIVMHDASYKLPCSAIRACHAGSALSLFSQSILTCMVPWQCLTNAWENTARHNCGLYNYTYIHIAHVYVDQATLHTMQAWLFLQHHISSSFVIINCMRNKNKKKENLAGPYPGEVRGVRWNPLSVRFTTPQTLQQSNWPLYQLNAWAALPPSFYYNYTWNPPVSNAGYGPAWGRG